MYIHRSYKDKVMFKSSISIGLSYSGSYKMYLNEYRLLVCLVLLSVYHRYGDYPKLPDKSHHERDPWYQWDQPDMRHNWGEPVGMLVAPSKLLMLLLLSTNMHIFFVLSV